MNERDKRNTACLWWGVRECVWIQHTAFLKVMGAYQCFSPQHQPSGVLSLPPRLQLPEAPPFSSHLEQKKTICQ